MHRKKFLQIRQHFGKTQNQIAQLLGVSLKAVQSFEQGWRNIPASIQRQLLFLLALKGNGRKRPCWMVQRCPVEIRQNCPVWEFQAGYICWYINGTICKGEVQESWEQKIRICRRCKVFRSMLPFFKKVE